MKLITLSGVDGCGKSTQAQKVITHLESHKKRVFHFHVVSFSIANVLRSSKKKNGAPQTTPAVTHVTPFQRFLRSVAFFIDIARFRLLILSLWWDGIDYIISDRYFYDTAVNIAYLSPRTSFSFAEKLIPRPVRAFFLNVPPHAILNRTRVPEQGIAYLQEKNDLFHRRISSWNMIMIDADRQEETVFEDIIRKIP